MLHQDGEFARSSVLCGDFAAEKRVEMVAVRTLAMSIERYCVLTDGLSSGEGENGTKSESAKHDDVGALDGALELQCWTCATLRQRVHSLFAITQ